MERRTPIDGCELTRNHVFLAAYMIRSNLIIFLLAVYNQAIRSEDRDENDMLVQQEAQRMFGRRAELEASEIEQAMSQRHLLYDDDHVYSASPTENTYANEVMMTEEKKNKGGRPAGLLNRSCK